MRVALIPNTEKQGAKEVAVNAVRILKAAGAEVFSFLEGIGAELETEEKLYSACDVILTVGGDGTIIRSAKKAAAFGRPVLGINVGRLGFLAEVEKDNLSALENVVKGEYTLSHRFMVNARVYENEELVTEGVAINDAVMASGSIAKLLDIEVDIAEETLSYRSDGIIISTPTGSTAYSMSAGGPIIDPNVRCFAVTPICSHSLTTRPMIIGEDEKLILRLPKDKRENAVFSLDGRFCCNVNKDVYIELTKAPYDALFVSLKGKGIYKTLSKKFRR